jgi:hypothetical protein
MNHNLSIQVNAFFNNAICFNILVGEFATHLNDRAYWAQGCDQTILATVSLSNKNRENKQINAQNDFELFNTSIARFSLMLPRKRPKQHG